MGKTAVLYGIPNCDTVKKARTWLDEHGVAYVFHDFKKAGLDASLVQSWLADVPWDTLANRKGTTWRALPDDVKASAIDGASVMPLLVANPSIVKRPVLWVDGHAHVGFSAERYEAILKNESENS